MPNIQVNQLPESTDVSSEDLVHIKKTDLVDYKMKQKNLMVIGVQDTKVNLTTLNPILKRGQFSLETDTKVMKIGDGITPYNNLSAHKNIKYGAVQTTSFNAELNTIYPIDTSSGVVNITLPTPLDNSSWFGVYDYAGTFVTNNAVLKYNTNKINGVTEDVRLDLKFLNIGLNWTGSNTMGWRTL